MLAGGLEICHPSRSWLVARALRADTRRRCYDSDKRNRFTKANYMDYGQENKKEGG